MMWLVYYMYTYNIVIFCDEKILYFPTMCLSNISIYYSSIKIIIWNVWLTMYANSFLTLKVAGER